MIKDQDNTINDWNFGTSNIKKVYRNNSVVYYKISGSSPTPEYTELEYIASTSTGSQYIDLNLYMFSASPLTYELDMKANLIGNGSDNHNQCVLFGAMEEVSPWPGFAIRRYDSYVRQTDYPFVSSYGDLNTIITFNPSVSNYSVTTHDRSTTLFCGLDVNGDPFRYSESRIYYCKIWLGGTLVRDLVPMLRNSDGVAGLYDRANDVFYTSPNGALFEYQELS